MEFERNPVATLNKGHTNSDKISEVSWRRVGGNDSDDMQLHTVIYDSSDVPRADSGSTFVYAHWEKRPDHHPLAHLRSKDCDPEKGRQMMRDILNRNGYSWDSTRPSQYST